MSHGYRAVGWNRQKRHYDVTLWMGIALFIGVFVVVGATRQPAPTVETLLIRAFGSCALVLLHVVLAIGPLCRLDPRWLPLLYNRRHLGVSMFLVALAHGTFAFVQFHTLGVLHPLVSLLSNDGRWLAGDNPFQPLGLAALLILFFMAATSHDFWLANLTPSVWKSLHMGVYAAYALVVLHVALGLFQDTRSPALVGMLAAGMAWLLTLHVVAGWRERAGDRPLAASVAPEREEGAAGGDIDCGPVANLPDGRARIIALGGERVAVYRDGDRVVAVSNVCAHQNGPLGEGRVIDGLITCPWHGYQYRLEDGCSPPPFEERIPTFRVRVADGRVWVHPTPLPLGTRVEPARIGTDPVAATRQPGAPTAAAKADADCDTDTDNRTGNFYIGYQPSAAPAVVQFLRPRVVGLLALAGIIAGVVAGAMPPNAPSHFYFGDVRSFVGQLDLTPVPMLTAYGTNLDAGVGPRLLLVAEGKYGLDAAALAGLDHRTVRLRGTLAVSGTHGLVEVVAGSVEAAPDDVPIDAPVPSAEPGSVPLDGDVLVGELTEAKCFLGVMNPGHGIVHRACAALCLRGGIPPIFVGHVRPPTTGRARTAAERDGGVPMQTNAFLLVGDDGHPIDPAVAASWAGRPMIVPVVRAEGVAGWTVVSSAPSRWRDAGPAAANTFVPSTVGPNSVCRIPQRPPLALAKDAH